GIVALPALAVRADEKPPRGDARFIGRWDVTVQGPDGPYPSWFEIRRSGRRTLVGAFVGRFGSARPIGRIEVTGDQFRFAVPPEWEDRKDDVTYEGRLDGSALAGETSDEKGQRLKWTARPAPSLKRERAPTWGKQIDLFDGKSLAGWKPQHEKLKN